MEHISKAITKVTSNLPSTLLENWQIEILEKYGDKVNFLKIFNPDNQIAYVKNELRCFSGTAPTLVRISKVYGEAVAESWIEIQLHDLSKFTGCKEKMELKQFEATAKSILLNYRYLKVTELMVFFQKFKAGFYGKFYGVVDGLVITSALYDFLQYRSKKLDEAMRVEKNKRLEKLYEEMKNSITYEEYLKLKSEKQDVSDSDKKS